MTENYFEAAIRHYIDATAMQQEEKYDSAVCLYGNSAECVLKELIRVYLGSGSREILMRKYNHQGKELKNDLFDFIANSGDVPLLDPALGLKLRDFIMPEVLFLDHPERRYCRNGKYNMRDACRCKEATDFLITEMIRQYVDGYIT